MLTLIPELKSTQFRKKLARCIVKELKDVVIMRETYFNTEGKIYPICESIRDRVNKIIANTTNVNMSELRKHSNHRIAEYIFNPLIGFSYDHKKYHGSKYANHLQCITAILSDKLFEPYIHLFLKEYKSLIKQLSNKYE